MAFFMWFCLLTLPIFAYGDKWTLQKGNVCFGAKGNDFGKFQMIHTGTLSSIKLVHKSGYVSCRCGMFGPQKTHFGCALDGLLSTIITTHSDHVVFPSNMRRHDGKYRLPNYTPQSNELVLDNPTSHNYHVTKGQPMRIWYGEDLVNHWEGDNCGRSCVDVYADVTVDGGWGDWYESDGPCSATCGAGTKILERNCNKPVPINGGKDCVGERRKTEVCNLKPCSNVCDSGMRTREDTSRGANSPGKCCVFPFVFSGKTFMKCKSFDDDKQMSWCATTNDYPNDGKWGICPRNTASRAALTNDACPKQPNVCPISISTTNERRHCKEQRLHSVSMARRFYKLTTDGQRMINEWPFPWMPFLNQTEADTESHTIFDPVDAKYRIQHLTLRKVTNKIVEQLMKRFAKTKFSRAEDYVNIFSEHNRIIENLNIPRHYYSNPAMDPTFTDVIKNKRYLTDDVFVQARLAGPCPFLIKLITRNRKVGLQWSKLKAMLNPSFDFDGALRKATGRPTITMEHAVRRTLLYAVYHDELNNIETMPDVLSKAPLLKVTSPIALFARTSSGDLKVVAIQIDRKSASAVYTPQDDDAQWTLAKTIFNMADTSVCNAVWHTSHIHVSSAVYCITFRSHFSELHPIYQIMRHHCEGTGPHFALNYKSLLLPKSLVQKTFAISYTGYGNLTDLGFHKFRYGKLAYDNVLESHGLNSKKLRYHPFRDDGELIWNALKEFSKRFVDLYYKKDGDVTTDKELQSFANQVSDAGKGDPYGGKGNINGFPSEFRKKREVRLFITRFLWHLVMHTAVNYVLEPWGSFIPLVPTKLYDTSNKPGATINDAFPDKMSTFLAIGGASLLGNIRINRIFDHHNKVKDNELRKLIKEYHDLFHGCIQKKLERRNKKRKERDEMGFQYFEPKWLPNSVHV